MTGRKEKKKFKWAKILQGAVCLSLILCGMSLCMESVLELPIPWQARLLAVLALTVLLQPVQLGVKWALAELLVLAGGLTVFCITYQEILLIGVKQLANRGLELINAYNRTEYLLWYLDVQEDYSWIVLLMVFVLLGFFEGWIFLSTRDRHRHFLAIAMLPAALVLAGLLVGWAASFVGIFLMFSGLLWEVFDMGERGNLVLGVIVAASLGIPILLVGNGKLWGQVEQLHEGWYRRQLNLEDQMLAWLDKVSDLPIFSFGERRQYTLHNEKPKYEGKEVFKITVDYLGARPLYIRGFVGGTYENGRWNRISRQEFSDWARQEGSDEKEYAELVQSFPYEFLMHSQLFWSVGQEKHVSLKLAQEKKDCALMPYFTKYQDSQTLLADGIYPPVKETEFEWDSYLELTDYDRELVQGWTVGTWRTFELKEKSRIFDEYKKYAQKHYTGLPEEGLEEFRTYAKQYREEHPSYCELNEAVSKKMQASGKTGWTLSELQELLTEEELQVLSISERQYTIQEIQKMLWEDNEYSLDLTEVPEGEDSVEYFLFDQHKGFCTHFAAAATLFFRMNDVPARFVSGYVVLPSDFKKNEDGTWTASVTDERAHAWTEIFYDNIGFCPVETTPPEYTELLEGMEDGQNLTQAVRQMEEEQREQEEAENSREQEELEDSGSQEESENSGSQEELKDSGEKEKKETLEADSERGEKETQGKGNLAKTAGAGRTFPMWGVWMLLSLVVLTSIFLALWQRRRWILHDRLRRVTAEDRMYAVREIGREMGKILRLMGKRRPSQMSDREYCDFLAQEAADIDWERAFFLFQKAEFSQHGVTEEEYQEIFLTYQKLGENLASMGGIRGWYLRYIKIYP